MTTQKAASLVAELNVSQNEAKEANARERLAKEAIEDYFYDIVNSLLPDATLENPKTFEPSDEFPIVMLKSRVGSYVQPNKIKSICRMGEAWSDIMILTDSKYNSVLSGKDILYRCENLSEFLHNLEKAAENT